MTKRTESKYKINRRLGVNLWGRPKSPVNKQKLKGYYGNIGERQFRRYYQEAVRRRGDTGHNLVELLERRLDAVVYRAKFVPTVFAARQFVNHGHIQVNGKRVNIPSYQIKDGDEIKIKAKSRELEIVLQGVESPERDVPEYLEVDHKDMKARFVRGPKLEDVPYPVQMEPNLVIEYYSR
jgi:small subunit ribosomal protein S4